MMSPGGKIEWICPGCHSGDIHRRRAIASSDFGFCNNCGALFAWRSRIKLSKNQRLMRLISGEVNGSQRHKD